MMRLNNHAPVWLILLLVAIFIFGSITILNIFWPTIWGAAFFFLRPEFLALSSWGKLAVSCGYILVMLILALVAVHDEEKRKSKSEQQL